MSPLSVPNFSPILARIRVLWRLLRNVRNEEVEEEKNEEIKGALYSSYKASQDIVCFALKEILWSLN